MASRRQRRGPSAWRIRLTGVRRAVRGVSIWRAGGGGARGVLATRRRFSAECGSRRCRDFAAQSKSDEIVTRTATRQDPRRTRTDRCAHRTAEPAQHRRTRTRRIFHKPKDTCAWTYTHTRAQAKHKLKGRSQYLRPFTAPSSPSPSGRRFCRSHCTASVNERDQQKEVGAH